MSGKILNVFLVVILILGTCGIAYAVSSYKTQFNTRYGTAGTTWINACFAIRPTQMSGLVTIRKCFWQ